VSNDDEALELYRSDPDVSEAKDQADASAGIFSSNVDANAWREDEALNSTDHRSFMAGLVRNPLFSFPPSFRPRNEIYFVLCRLILS